MNDEKTIRCTTCAKEFSISECEEATGCPNCGSEGLPCHIVDDVYIRINWHELRILTMWAANFSRNCSDDAQMALASIIQRLEAQFPKMAPLTLLGELKQAQEVFPGLEAYDSDGNVILAKKKVN